MSVVSDTLSHENNNYDPINTVGSNDKNSPNDEFNNDINSKCNLIINYLPHDIDDNGLRVSISLVSPLFFVNHILSFLSLCIEFI